jgi:hypothetical protein
MKKQQTATYKNIVNEVVGKGYEFEKIKFWN